MKRTLGVVAAASLAAGLLLTGCSPSTPATEALDRATCDALLKSGQPAPAAAPVDTTATPVTPSKISDDAEQKKTITFVGGAYTQTTVDYWTTLAAAFEEKNPGYKVNVQIIDWNNIDQQVATMIQTQQYPDILNQNKFSGWAQDGLLRPADSLIEADVLDDFVPGFRDASVFDGTQYALPFIASTRALFYNKQAFADAGIDAPPQTWSELVETAEKLKEAGYTGFGLPLGSEEPQAEWTIWSWGNGGDWKTDGEFVMNSEQNVETLTVLNCLANVYEVTQANPGQTNRTDGVFRSFADGKVGMMNGASFAPNIFAGWEASVDYGVAPLVVNGDSPSFTLGVQDYLMAFDNPGNSEAVSMFLNFFYEEENYLEFLTSQGFLPTTESASAALADDSQFAPFVDLLPTARFYPSTDPRFPSVQGALAGQIGTGVQPGADVTSILDNIQQAAE